MKLSFGWVALEPPGPGGSPRWIHTASHLGAFAAFAGGYLQLGLGLEDGWFALAPLIVSALFFGLPHGAIDHLVALGLTGATLGGTNLLRVVALYLSLSLLFALLWLLVPLGALIAFLLITIYHWGKADTAFERIMDPHSSSVQHSWQRQLQTALRGLIPIGIPFLAFPAETSAFLHSCTELFGAPAADLEPWRWAIGTLLALLLIGDLVNRLRTRSATDGRAIAESFALCAFFFLVPPLVAIGWYFCLWHGLRHVLRLCRYQTYQAGPAGERHPITLFFIRATPFTLLSLAFLAVAAMFLPMDADPSRWGALYLVLISTLTFPHMILVEWMDRRELRSAGDATKSAS